MDYQKLVRKDIKPLKPYSNTRSLYQGTILLDDMESPFWGDYKINISDVPLNRYPDGMFQELRTKIAQYIGYNTKKDNVVLGNGSDELINLLIQIFLEPDENIVITPPTFTMYKLLTQIRGAEVREVPLKKETFQFDVAGILKAIDKKTKIIFLCNPNNPTGALMNRGDVEAIVSKTNCIVVVDEAYGEYLPENSPTFIKELKHFENLVVFRTFSKAWGLAGLRCGYAVAPAWLITEFDKIRLPFNVDRLTATIVDQVLDQETVMRKTIEKLTVERKFLEQELKNLGLKIYPTITNFLCVQLPQSTIAKDLVKKLAEDHGILVRDRSKEVNLENSIRVSVENLREKNQKFITALRSFLN